MVYSNTVPSNLLRLMSPQLARKRLGLIVVPVLVCSRSPRAEGLLAPVREDLPEGRPVQGQEGQGQEPPSRWAQAPRHARQRTRLGRESAFWRKGATHAIQNVLVDDDV